MLIPTLKFNNFIPIIILLYKANYSSHNISVYVFFKKLIKNRSIMHIYLPGIIYI